MAQSQAEAQRLSDAFVFVADKVGPSVVQIDVTERDQRQDPLIRWLGGAAGDSPIARGTGSGVVFSADGAILTNNHVIENALTISVHLRDGRVLPGRLLGRDPETDLAVVKVDATGLVPAAFADSDAARVGEWVVAIGSPLGFTNTVTAGILSAKGRGLNANAIEDFLQTDASINPGKLGGAALRSRRKGARDQHAHRRRAQRRGAHRVRGRVEHGPPRGRADPEDGSRGARVDRRGGPGADSGARGGAEAAVSDGGARERRSPRGARRKANLRAGDVIAAMGGSPFTTGATSFVASWRTTRGRPSPSRSFATVGTTGPA